ncbi:MAG: tetratricopeptide repeat protein [Beijerinckiaceae bacterium]
MITGRNTKRALGPAGALVAAMLLAGCNTVAGPELAAGAPPAEPAQAVVAKVEGNVPPSTDEIKIAKAQFHKRNFGEAEKGFRAVVEKEPKNAEAWLGLAASYDQLKRFELADRAYQQVSKIDGPSVALHNNRGYSFLLRGDRRKARQEFLKASGMEPNNAFVRNNLRALALNKSR